MSWQGIEEHDEVVERFRTALARGRLASSFLFVGPVGIGKHRFALKLAEAFLCQTHPEAMLDPCGSCAGCVQVRARTHPDLLLVAKPAEKSRLPLELLIGDKEHRMRQGLCHDIALKPYAGGRKIAIVDDADYLNPEGANSLLKTLEEPPPGSILILIGTSPAKQLPTIRSRCQVVRFGPLGQETVAGLLLREGIVKDRAEADRLAARSGGSVGRAVEWREADLGEFRRRLFQRLAQPRFESVLLAKVVLAFVDEAGREAALRRERLRQVVRMGADFYHQLVRALTAAPASGDEESTAAVRAAEKTWAGDYLAAAACLDRCLKALEQIDRNVHQVTLVECWLDDLRKVLDRRERPTR